MGTGNAGLEGKPQVKEIVFVGMTAQMSGVEYSTLYLARGLDRARWSPLVVCPEEGELIMRSREAKIPVALVPRPHFFSTSVRIAGRALVNPFAIIANLFALFIGAFPLAKFLRARKPGLVVTKGLLVHFYGGLAAKMANVPCVWHVQDRVSDRLGPIFAWVLALGGRWLAREIIVDAESIAKQLKPVVPNQRISVIWNGVDTSEFSPSVDGSHVRSEWQVRDDDLLIGVIGRLTPWKGQHVLIDAFAQIAERLPQTRIVIVGSALFDTDAYARALRSAADQHGLDGRVLFAGYRADMPQVLAALDIVAHTALEKDSSPLAVVSAMAAGKPIICSNVEGTAPLFDPGVDGLIVPLGDGNALAQQLDCLIQNPERRQALGRAARAKAERELGLDRFAQRCETIFARTLA